MITIEVLEKVFTVVLTISLSAERLIEIAKPLLEKIAPAWQPPAKIFSAILIGFGLSALFRFDLLAELFVVGLSPILGYLLSGMVASAGSSVIHPILEWLKALQPRDTQRVIETTVLEGATTTKTTEVTR